MYAREFIRGIIDGASNQETDFVGMQAGATLALAMLEYNKQFNDDEWPGTKRG